MKILSSDQEISLRNAMFKHDVAPSKSIDFIADGKWYRYHVTGDKSTSKNGWYCLFNNGGFIYGVFGSWKSGVNAKWSSMPLKKLSHNDQDIYKTKLEQAKKTRQREQIRQWNEVADKCLNRWEAASPALDIHPYLIKKGVKPHGLRQIDNTLLVPLYDDDKRLASLQFINQRGEKRFKSGGKTKGCYYQLGIPRDTIYITEGYATAASVYELTGTCTFVSFTANNLKLVAQLVAQYFPDCSLIIVADNDWNTKGNPGLNKAKEASELVGAKYVFPEFNSQTQGSDFNDLLLSCGPDIVLQHLNNQIDPWPEPLPLGHTLPPVEPFNLDLLPQILQDFVQDVAHRLQVPLDYIAIPLIIALSSVIGTRCAVYPKEKDNWHELPNLWGLLIGQPSQKKTPSIKVACELLKKLEDEANESYKTLYEDYKRKKEEHDTNKKVLKKEKEKLLRDKYTRANSATHINGNDEQLNTICEQINSLHEPLRPTRVRKICNDSTIEKLSELLQENPTGILIALDEMSSLFASFKKQGRELDRAFYLKAWSGGTQHVIDRVGRGTTTVEQLCISLCGAIQPEVIFRYIQEEMSNSSNDGLSQRLQLMVYPDEIVEHQYVDEYPDKKAHEAVCGVFAAINTMNFNTHSIDPIGGKTGYRFTHDAQDVYRDWDKELTNKVRDMQKGNLPILAQHLSKYPSLMISLALIFHIVDMSSGHTSSSRIGKENVLRACAWCEYLESHAKRVYQLAMEKRKATVQEQLSSNIRARKVVGEFTYRDIIRKNWSGLSNKNQITMAIKALIANNWLLEVKKDNKTVYRINPKVMAEEGTIA